MGVTTLLNDCINYLLTGAQHTVFQMMKKELSRYDITPIQYGVLKCIWERDVHNPKDMAAILGIDNSTISGILERMELKKLITREADQNDHRYIRISLTEKGRDLEEPVNRTVDKVNESVMSQFTEEEMKRLSEDLRKIAGM